MNIHVSELLLILLVALLVIKPERLPDIAYRIGRWVKWIRQMAVKMKHEINKLQNTCHNYLRVTSV